MSLSPPLLDGNHHAEGENGTSDNPPIIPFKVALPPAIPDIEFPNIINEYTSDTTDPTSGPYANFINLKAKFIATFSKYNTLANQNLYESHLKKCAHHKAFSIGLDSDNLAQVHFKTANYIKTILDLVNWSCTYSALYQDSMLGASDLELFKELLKEQQEKMTECLIQFLSNDIDVIANTLGDLYQALLEEVYTIAYDYTYYYLHDNDSLPEDLEPMKVFINRVANECLLHYKSLLADRAPPVAKDKESTTAPKRKAEPSTTPFSIALPYEAPSGAPNKKPASTQAPSSSSSAGVRGYVPPAPPRSQAPPKNGGRGGHEQYHQSAYDNQR